ISARNSRSTARSTSVTRSIAPFLSTRMARPKCAICTSPARITDSIAVARKRGASGSGTGREFLDHPHFHAALFAAAPQHHVVHEAPHEEDAAPARLEEILRRQRIGHVVRIESLPFVEDADDEFVGIV